MEPISILPLHVEFNVDTGMQMKFTVFKTEQVGYILKYISTLNLVAVGGRKAAEVIVTVNFIWMASK